jgi:translation initiation factor 6 (eIF-6)
METVRDYDSLNMRRGHVASSSKMGSALVIRNTGYFVLGKTSKTPSRQLDLSQIASYCDDIWAT